MYIEYNPNPVGSRVGDCVVRAVSKALNTSWEDAYVKLCVMGFVMGDLPNNDNVFGALLRMHGFKKKTLSDTCPDCYTVKDFALDNPYGTYVLGLGSHVVAVEDGDIYDSFDSSYGIPIYYWYKSTEERMNRNGTEPDTVLLRTTNELPAACDVPTAVRSTANEPVPAPAANAAASTANAAKPAAK